MTCDRTAAVGVISMFARPRRKSQGVAFVPSSLLRRRVPFGIHPWRHVVNRHHRGAEEGTWGPRKFSTVKHGGLLPAQLQRQADGPPPFVQKTFCRFQLIRDERILI